MFSQLFWFTFEKCGSLKQRVFFGITVVLIKNKLNQQELKKKNRLELVCFWMKKSEINGFMLVKVHTSNHI